ncbi:MULTISPECIES: PAS domain S-box protein [Haloferax]|uniref:histidine kinase n=1 Tax=Haloferax marinum TaxID=2666143 RepID=A0A6A8G8R5_9EURY|nr:MULTISPECIES: PAS domain S-box protein [Haloferax]KAB1197933.1 PAS domain S-box protein [Haloferax sp. CBA1150]MRW96998.1 PAS domain S-box protein [Haloferax marinum]
MTGRVNLLVVDENERVGERLAAALPDVVDGEATTVHVETATSIEAGRSTLERSRVDCLVVSTELEDGDRGSLTAVLRTDGVPVVSYERTSPSDIDLENLGRAVSNAVQTTNKSLDHRALFESIDVGIAVRDLDTLELIDINHRYLDILGADQDTVLTTAPIDLTADVPGYTAERAHTEVQTALETGSNEFLWPMENAGGELIWVHVSLSTAELSGHEYLISTVEDVTEDRRREQELEAFKSAVAAVDAGIALTEDGEHVYINDTGARICGYADSESMLGLPWGDLHSEAETDRIRDVCDEALESDGRWQGEVTIRRPDGTDVPVRLTLTSLSDDRNVVVFQDLTEQKERERELERSRDFLDRTQRISKVGGWELDLLDETLEWTDQTKRIHGVPQEYVPSLDDALDFYAPDQREEVRTLVERCRNEGATWEDDFRFVTADGAERWVRTRGEPVIRDGRVVALRGTIQDVTARRSRERELERMNAELEALNRIIRHDIRNDMAVIVGWAELLDDHVDDEGHDILARVLSTGRHTIEITEVSRDLIETMSGDTVGTHPVSLVDSIERELSVRHEAYPNATFEIDGEIPDVAVRANPLLASVFGNVLGNAIKHNDCDTTVTLSAQVDASDDGDDVVVVRVADDGVGIPDSRKEVVFGKGEKGLESSGTGLGLYLVNKLVESFGGSVRIEDNDPTGTVVVIELPVASAV